MLVLEHFDLGDVVFVLRFEPSAISVATAGRVERFVFGRGHWCDGSGLGACVMMSEEMCGWGEGRCTGEMIAGRVFHSYREGWGSYRDEHYDEGCLHGCERGVSEVGGWNQCSE